MIPAIDELSAREVLLAVEENRRNELSAGAELLALAAHWCDLHGDLEFDRQRRVIPGGQLLVALGGDGTPEVEEFAAAEFGVMRHLHPMAARNLMADALDLRHRLPRLWTALHELRVEAWLCRRIAAMTRRLGAAAAAYVDAAIASYVESLPAGRLLALVEARMIEADPDGAEEQRVLAGRSRFVRTTPDEHGLRMLVARAAAGDVLLFADVVDRIAEILATRGDDDSADIRRSKAMGILAVPAKALRLLLEAGRDAAVGDEAEPRSLLELLGALTPGELRPRLKLFVHLSQDTLTGARNRVGRVEGVGPMVLAQVREWLGHADVAVTPVLDLADQRPVDGYEFPARIVEALHQLQPADVFPWSVSTGRRKDTDHCTAYVPRASGGPPGQTGLHNGARLARHHHRIKTFADWQLTSLSPGRYLWRSPHGFTFLVDQDGTHRVPESVLVAFRPRENGHRSRAEESFAKAIMRAG